MRALVRARAPDGGSLLLKRPFDIKRLNALLDILHWSERDQD